MIGRLAGTAAGAAAPVAIELATKASPVEWSLLGYHFGAAGMVAALFGCGIARFWRGSVQGARSQYRWQLDLPITLMTLGTTVAMVVTFSPVPWQGLLYGMGLGVVGEGIFKLAERMLRASGMFDDPA